MDRFSISSEDDENIVFWVNGNEVGTANHDMHGWAGMEGMEDMFRFIAATLDYTVEDLR